MYIHVYIYKHAYVHTYRETDKRTDILACEWHVISSIRGDMLFARRQLISCLFWSEYMPYPV